MTNFERITESPKALADFLGDCIECCYCEIPPDGPLDCPAENSVECKKIVLAWLEALSPSIEIVDFDREVKAHGEEV